MLVRFSNTQTLLNIPSVSFIVKQQNREHQQKTDCKTDITTHEAKNQQQGRDEAMTQHLAAAG